MAAINTQKARHWRGVTVGTRQADNPLRQEASGRQRSAGDSRCDTQESATGGNKRRDAADKRRLHAHGWARWAGHLARADVGDGAAVQAERLGKDGCNGLLPHCKAHAHTMPAHQSRCFHSIRHNKAIVRIWRRLS